MIDTYAEQMIVKEPSNSDRTKKNLLMIGSILLSAVILLAFGELHSSYAGGSVACNRAYIWG